MSAADRIRKLMDERVVIFEGAMGTLLQEAERGVIAPDALNLERPDLVLGLHRTYAALADVIHTNTFGANRLKLESVGLADRISEINREGARLARSAAGGGLVAGDMGPTGRLIDPLGDLSFWDAYEAFREQATLLADGGVDLLLIETMTDLREAKAALLGAREASDLPVIVTMTFDESYVAPTGTDPATAANVLASMGAFAVGANCSTGPSAMIEVVGRMAQVTAAPIIVQPNAGLPELVDGRTVFRMAPDEFAEKVARTVAVGAGMVGGCCGTTPAHIDVLAGKLRTVRPVARSLRSALRLSSRSRTVEIGSDFPFAVVGERINPTNRDDLTGEVLDGRVEAILRDGHDQAAAGAHVLDVNVGVPGVDETVAMPRAVRALENAVATPLSIDSVSAEAFEAALGGMAGKPLLNSVTGAPEKLESVLPIAARWGAGVVCLALDESGIMARAEDRIAVLRRIVAAAERHGVPRDHLILDCLTLAVSAEQERVPETLRAVRLASSELGLPTILGVSNVSHGLPDRSVLNASFLAMAMAAGLDAAIMNPLDESMMAVVRASSVLTLRDRDSADYIREHARRRKKKGGTAPAPPESVEGRIRQAVFDGDVDGVEPLVDEALAGGLDPVAINETLLIPSLQEIGKRFERRECFLPQMMLAAETVERAFSKLEPLFPKAEVGARGTIVVATVEGDVHDIGKNILASVLRNNGYRVVDLGKNVPAAAIVETARERAADVVALSALMTTTVAQMPVVIGALKEAGLSPKVMVGGAVVTKRFAESIGADGYAKDAAGAVELLGQLLQK